MAQRDSAEPLSDHTLAEIDLDELTRYIIRQHHDYIRRITPTVSGWLETLVSKDGERHPELAHIQSTFASLSHELASHMLKEENILFPFIDLLAATRRLGGPLPSGPFGTILNPIRMMEDDHRGCLDRLATLRRLSHAYVPPPGACAIHRRCFEELARFEDLLHRYVHLENQVLFPRALDLEQHLG